MIFQWIVNAVAGDDFDFLEVVFDQQWIIYASLIAAAVGLIIYGFILDRKMAKEGRSL